MSYTTKDYQVKNFDLESWNKIKKIEFLHDANMKGGWEFDFTKALKKIKEREKYDKVWELIKKKNNW
jgi:hypothetical protein